MTFFDAKPSAIFKDASWLQPLSDPPSGVPLYREEDLRLMFSLLSEVFKSGRARNIFVYGKPGTGKTACIKYLVNEVNKHAEALEKPVASVYVNAGETRSPYYTMHEILRGLGISVPEAGWQMFRLKGAFEKLLGEKAVVTAIDEVDCLLRKEREPLVYYLNRQQKTTLILTSNKFEDVATLPQRAISTLQPKFIKLEPYKEEEAYEILRERAEQAFHQDVCPDKAIRKAAAAAAILEDIRIGFAILLTAGLYAEKAGRNQISMEDVASAIRYEAKTELLRRRFSNLFESRRANRKSHGVDIRDILKTANFEDS